MINAIKQCKRCLMDDTATYWTETEKGCNYCSEFLKKKSQDFQYSEESLIKIIDEYKASGSEYDCILGLSGGIDSSYALHLTVELGLNPLVVNLNNSWDSELAQRNIEKLISQLNLNLFTQVLDWKEFRNLQLAFFDSDIVDVEILTDQAIHSTLVEQAKLHGVSLIITGGNFATEGLTMPPNWAIPEKRDPRLIREINKKFGVLPSRELSFPFYSLLDEAKDRLFYGIRRVPIINYYEYEREKVGKFLEDKYSFEVPKGKHQESVFTRLYQTYFIYRKHGIDKRKNHLSSLILTNQINREEAYLEIQKYPFEYAEFDDDLRYFLDKFQWGKFELEQYLSRPGRDFSEFKNSQFRALRQIRKKLKAV